MEPVKKTICDSCTSFSQLLSTYYHSGQYYRDIQFVVGQASGYIRSLPKTTGRETVILDIDETCLDNSPAIESFHKEEVWQAWLGKGQAESIPATLELYKEIIEKGYRVIFITGRDEGKRQATERNLQVVGYEKWDEIYFYPILEGVNGPCFSPIFGSAANYKTAVRWTLVARGYQIVANIGDQTSDLAGGYAQKTFKLPNPFYAIA
jgi:acid phosphatase